MGAVAVQQARQHVLAASTLSQLSVSATPTKTTSSSHANTARLMRSQSSRWPSGNGMGRGSHGPVTRGRHGSMLGLNGGVRRWRRPCASPPATLAQPTTSDGQPVDRHGSSVHPGSGSTTCLGLGVAPRPRARRAAPNHAMCGTDGARGKRRRPCSCPEPSRRVRRGPRWSRSRRVSTHSLGRVLHVVGRASRAESPSGPPSRPNLLHGNSCQALKEPSIPGRRLNVTPARSSSPRSER